MIKKLVLVSILVPAISYAASDMSMCDSADRGKSATIPCSLPYIKSDGNSSISANNAFIAIEKEQTNLTISNKGYVDIDVITNYFKNCKEADKKHFPKQVGQAFILHPGEQKALSFDTNCTPENLEAKWPGYEGFLGKIDIGANKVGGGPDDIFWKESDGAKLEINYTK
ncbi:MAG: hypothetical protein WAW86_00260 [Gammaproteobacteria bacterium]